MRATALFLKKNLPQGATRVVNNTLPHRAIAIAKIDLRFIYLDKNPLLI
jgi:hypothetical protein